MSEAEPVGLQIDWSDQEALFKNIQQGQWGEVGKIALKKPLKIAHIRVTDAGPTFDLEAAVETDSSYSSIFEQQRRKRLTDIFLFRFCRCPAIQNCGKPVQIVGIAFRYPFVIKSVSIGQFFNRCIPKLMSRKSMP